MTETQPSYLDELEKAAESMKKASGDLNRVLVTLLSVIAKGGESGSDNILSSVGSHQSEA